LSSSIFVGPNFVENSCHAASNDGASNRDRRRSIGADRAFRRPRREREAAALARDPRQLGCGARVIRGEDHPDRRHDGVERRVVDRQALRVADAIVDRVAAGGGAPLRDLDQPRRQVDAGDDGARAGMSRSVSATSSNFPLDQTWAWRS